MKNLKVLLEYQFLFLYLGLILGLQLIYVNPPWHTNDEDRHFYNAYALSSGQLIPAEEKGKVGLFMPLALAKDVASFQGIRFCDTIKVKKKVLVELRTHPLNKHNKVFVENASALICPIGYLPAAIFIKIATSMNLSPIEIGYWGRIGSLFAYLIIIFFAIKITPYFKSVFFLIALSPMSLYQGSSVTYDTMNLALLFLLSALTLKFYFQKEKISINQLLLFFSIAFLHRFVKDGYLFLYLLPLLINISKYKSKIYFIYSFCLFIIASFIPSKIWDFHLQYHHLAGSIALEKDFLFDLMGNLQFHLSSPIMALTDISDNLFNQSKVWILGSVGRFGYSYTLLPTWFSLFILLSFVFAAAFEKINNNLLRFNFRLLIIIILVGNILAIISMFYLLSPVGASMIFGLQGRYFTPFLPLLFSMAFYLNIPKKNIPYLHVIIPTLATITLLFTINYLDNVFYISR